MPKAKILLIAILCLIVIWLSICNPPILYRLRLSAVSIFTLPLRLANTGSLNLKNFMEAKLYSKWIKENTELKGRIEELSFELTKLKELEAESKRLTDLLEFKKETAKAGIPARVIGMDSALFFRSIVIDKGKTDGIEIGMAVVSKRGVVGRVVESDSRISRVMLLDDPDFRLGVIIQRTREQALFVGGPHGTARIIYLSTNSDAKEGDAVISFSSNRMFPKGLLVGYVRDVMYESAGVKVAVDYSRLEEVLCVK